MKKTIVLGAITLMLALVSCDDEKVLAVNDYPNEITSYVTLNHADAKIMQVIKEKEGLKNEYKVILDNGTTLNFNNEYLITDIEGNRFNKSTVPSAAKETVKLVLPAANYPSGIVDHITSKHNNLQIVLLTETTKNGVKTYEALLENGTEVEFDQHQNMLKAEIMKADDGTIIKAGDYPKEILDIVNRDFNSQKIVFMKSEKEGMGNEYKAILDNGTELTFDDAYQLIKTEVLH